MKAIAALLLLVGLALLGFGLGNDLRLAMKDGARAQEMSLEAEASQDADMLEDAAWLQDLANQSKTRGMILSGLGVVALASGGFLLKKKV